MREKYWLTGMMGLIVGDALGGAVQFMKSENVARRPQGRVTGMEEIAPFGMPAGAWSDDSSMALATLDSINNKQKIDTGDIMVNFVKWLYKDEYTPTGECFDVGNTCASAIKNFVMDANPSTCGVTGEYANGNGALMRIMPVCLYMYDMQKNEGTDDATAVKAIHSVASLTHNALRSCIACGLYFFMLREIIENRGVKSLQECLQEGIDKGFKYYSSDISNMTQLSYYGRVHDLEEFKKLSDSDIRFDGYVLHTFEAAVWGLLNTDNYKDCLLKLVNYGNDSDSVGAVVGGLAALYYGYEDIPKDWINVIIRKDWIETIVMGA